MWWQKYTTAAALVRCWEVQAGSIKAELKLSANRHETVQDEIAFPKICSLWQVSHVMWYRLSHVTQWKSRKFSISLGGCVIWSFFNTSYSGNEWYQAPEAQFDRLQTSISFRHSQHLWEVTKPSNIPLKNKDIQWQHMPQHLEITMQHTHQTLPAQAETGRSLLFIPPATLLDCYPWNTRNDSVKRAPCLTKYTMQLTF